MKDEKFVKSRISKKTSKKCYQCPSKHEGFENIKAFAKPSNDEGPSKHQIFKLYTAKP